MLKILIVLLMSLPVVAQNAAAQLSQLAKTYRSITSYTGEFIYTRTSPFANTPMRRKVTVQGEKKYIEGVYDLNRHLVTVMNGKDTIWMVNPDKHTVLVRAHEANREPTELAMIMTADVVQSPKYLPDEAVTIESVTHQCTVIQGQISSTASATYWIDKVTGLVVQNVVRGQDSSITIQVVSFTPNAAVDQSLFTYKPHPNEAVIYHQPGGQEKF